MRDSLLEHRRIWDSNEPVNYSYTYRLPSTAAPAFRVTVRSGSIASVITLPDSTTRPAGDYLLIDRLFDQIEDHLRRPDASASIAYSLEFGFPAHTELSLRNVVDSYTVITISDFRRGP